MDAFFGECFLGGWVVAFGAGDAIVSWAVAGVYPAAREQSMQTMINGALPGLRNRVSLLWVATG